ncbi:hypothetical protein PG993_010600 [Apiospora rasikravindrae]|uniref:Peptidase S53 activation domain-containing protein n=1 Tax=Apiospora rasikravindrae TaxID=990691 RepID=A0ABR1SMS2_9PEZI
MHAPGKLGYIDHFHNEHLPSSASSASALPPPTTQWPAQPPRGHGLSSLLFLLATLFALATAYPLATTNRQRSTSPLSLSAGVSGAVAEAPPPPLQHLAPFPNENSTDPHIIPDEYIITLAPESSYAQLDAFMTETYGAPVDADRVDVLVQPGDPPRFDSYLWAHGVSKDWVYLVRTFPGTKQVSHNGYATVGAPRGVPEGAKKM